MGSSASSITPSASPESQEGPVVIVPAHVHSQRNVPTSATAASGVNARVSKPPRSGPQTKASTRQILTGIEMYASKQCMVRTNKVAPVIIKGCREEFQQFLELNEPIISGSLAAGMQEHPLIKIIKNPQTTTTHRQDILSIQRLENVLKELKRHCCENYWKHLNTKTETIVSLGKYFIVQDSNDAEDVLQTLKKISAPNFRQALSSQPVFASGQPTLKGFNKILDQITSQGYKDVIVLNLRSEPVLFQRVDDDCVPYSVRHREHIHNMVVMGDTKDNCDHIEACIRKEIVSLAGMKEEFVFYFYDNLKKLHHEPHVRKVEFEEDILLSAEIYARQAFSNQALRYDRICLPENGIPTEEMVDQFLSHFKKTPLYLDLSSKKFPAVYLVSHSGGQRSTIFMVMTCLLYGHVNGTLAQKCDHEIDKQNPNYAEGEYVAVQKLVTHMKDGVLIKYQVDKMIDQCSDVINLRKCIADHKKRLEVVTASNVTNVLDTNDSFYLKCVSALETYCFLISFNAYLQDQMPNNLNWTYNKWLHQNPEVIRLCSQLDFSEMHAPPALLSSQQRVLVSDDYIGLDVLSSQMEVKVSNFRRLMGLPIYGMAQPTRNGLSKVVNQLLQHKQGYTNVVVVNLRSDYVLECDDVTYSVRDASFLAEPIYSQASSGKAMEEMEQKFKKEIKSRKVWKVYNEITDPPVDKELVSVFTPEELYDQQRLSTLDMHYTRLPLQYDHGLHEQEFDAIQNLVLDFMKEPGSWTDSSHAFVFHCRTGKSRTSLTMAVAGLLFYHMTGFPYGANPDEQERVSCPNAGYTKGEFLVVEKLVWMLPEGHQVKREVDLVLDRLFETMSPMHFHLREVIFVTFNKSKSRTGHDQQSLHRLSYDFLERYLYLILYNEYLHLEKNRQFQRSFSKWMTEVAAPAGVYELLDNLGFFTLESAPSEYSRIKNRILDRHHKLPFTGFFA